MEKLTFAGVFGAESGQTWVDIVTEMKENLLGIYNSYGHTGSKADACARSLEEFSQPLGHGMLHVAIKYVPGKLSCGYGLCSSSHSHHTFKVEIDFI